MTANRLGAETSPYLLQHRDNPVHWEPWDQAALARARAEDKPILLSVGYAACHWCHVMAHESFEDTATAALMNELYVPIKVDREERPDLDQIYQHALALLGEQGGWPLTMFLTPSGEPFWGGTYFPPTARWGRPAFQDVLRGIARTWHEEPEKVRKNVSALGEALAGLSATQPGGPIDAALRDQAARRLARSVDPFYGGIGEAPKFPQPFVFELLWRAWLRTREEPFRLAVTRTLDRMSQGGIYDHLGGGYARYSVDAQWLVPHFEKMLYDNAQLVRLLTLVWQETKAPLYAQRVAETIDWLLREMTADGAFAAALDADSEGVEGKFYVWTEAEIDAALGAGAAAFKAAYDVSAEGNWEGHVILNRGDQALGPDDAEAHLAAARATLLARRAGRVRPGRDDKVLADWNGLMIAALAEAGMVFGRAEWIAAGADAFAAIERNLIGADGRLRHAFAGGRARHPATIDDHANLARAALALHEATGEARWIDAARRFVAFADAHHWDAAEGGYFFAAADTDDLITRPKHAHDNAVPAGNATMVGVLARLAALTGEEKYRARAEAIVAAFAGGLQRNVFPFATLLNESELLERPLQVVVVGPDDDPATGALLGAVLDRSLPNRILARLAPNVALPAGHPAHGKGMREGRPTAYVCEGPVCSAPIAAPDDLARRLDAGP